MSLFAQEESQTSKQTGRALRKAIEVSAAGARACVRSALTICVLATIMMPSAHAHKDRIDRMRSLTIPFAGGEKLVFNLDRSELSAATLEVGKKKIPVPPEVIAKLHGIRYDTAALLWDGKANSASAASYCYVQFEMGNDAQQAFGKLPLVQLHFKKGAFEKATVEKATSDNAVKISPL